MIVTLIAVRTALEIRGIQLLGMNSFLDYFDRESEDSTDPM